jgi:hypothetical protein
VVGVRDYFCVGVRGGEGLAGERGSGGCVAGVDACCTVGWEEFVRGINRFGEGGEGTG